MRRNRKENRDGQWITIECPNTIFDICVRNETEYSKLELFMNNIRTVSHLGIQDIYNWCNRQKMEYQTRFNYRKGQSVWRNLRLYAYYYKHKVMYQYQVSFQAAKIGQAVGNN